jgi:hypothetical protein
VAAESDKLVSDFAPPSSHGKRSQPGDLSGADEDEVDSAGGFCQPKDLSLFVNSSLQQRQWSAQGTASGGVGCGEDLSDESSSGSRCKRRAEDSSADDESLDCDEGDGEELQGYHVKEETGNDSSLSTVGRTAGLPMRKIRRKKLYSSSR